MSHILTYKCLICCLWESTFLIQQGQQTHWFLQEHIQEGPVVLVFYNSCINTFVKVFILQQETEGMLCLCTQKHFRK